MLKIPTKRSIRRCFSLLTGEVEAMVRTLLLGALMFILTIGLATAAGNGPKAAKGKKAQTVHCVVETVTKDTDKDTGAIVVSVKHKNKKGTPGATATPVERKVTVTAATKFFIVRGKKGAQEETPATFADVKAGERVLVVERAGKAHQADKVLIHKGK